MTTQTLEKKLGLPPFSKENPIYTDLVRRYPPRPIESEAMHKDYTLLAGRLMIILEDALIAKDRDGIERYLKVLIPFIRAYESRLYPESKAEPEEVLRFLMDQNGLKGVALAKELGGQPVVSCILNGKRRLTRDQIKRLSLRFGVSEASFYPSSR